MTRRREGKGGRQRRDPIAEPVSISVSIKLDNFLADEKESELKFPTFLTAPERAFIHDKVAKLGLKSKSRGVGIHRYLTVYKRLGSTLVQKDAKLILDLPMRQSIAELIEQYPITSKEKDDLNSCSERERAPLGLRTMGYLGSGTPQVPNLQINPEVADFKETLPIYEYKNQILSTISSNDAVVIVGETGSGKTTQIPQYILEQCQRENKPCRIICTQPRRISAVSVAERVAYERNEKVGQSIGYQIRLESRIGPKTVLTYCTNGVLLRTLMGGGSALASITHVIVDEAHERDKLSDFLLIPLREALPKFKDLTVVVMSATLDTSVFSRYFNDCPVLSIPGRLFHVERYFLEDILENINYKTKEMIKVEKDLKHRPKPNALANEPAEDKTAKKVTADESKSSCLDPELQADVDGFLDDCINDGSLDSFSQMLYMYVSEGVSVDCQHSVTKMTGMMAAAHHGLTETVEQFIKMGADHALQDSQGRNALDYAVINDHEECISFLENLQVQTVSVKEKTASHGIEEDNILLESYQLTVSDDVVDLKLIMALTRHIHLNMAKGSILVFLPGYDEIINLRDLIQACGEMSQAKYQIFTLHSNMQTVDQKRVFNQIPGTRKLILATNIAETSITIDDVVYVIDSGKVKQTFYEATRGVGSLQTVWVAKSCAMQRAGRAGRVQAGKAFMLCSKRRYESFAEHTVPEMMRVPLHELCLHSKFLAPGNTPIADFLSKALEPPSFLAIRNSVSLLKTIGALTPMEDLTEIGQHLLNLNIEPKFGKMLLYACILKCLDPILTIVCTLAYKEPFQISTDPNNRRLASQVRKVFAAETFSDHMSLLRAFQAWQIARSNKTEYRFCRENLISGATMEMIVGLRSQLLAQLRAIGLVKAKGPGDIKDANSNSEKWFVVKAVLASGLYPAIARVDRDDSTLRTSTEVKLAFHPSSTLNTSAGKVGLAKSLKALPTDWVVFEEITRVGRFCFIRCNTSVTALTVALFGGPLRLAPNALRSSMQGISDDSDSEADEDCPCPTADMSCMGVDDWIVFTGESLDALSIYLLRQKFSAMMIRRMLQPTKLACPMDEKIVATVVKLLAWEERNSGLNQPNGIGQRPKSVLMDYQNPRMKNNDVEYSNYDRPRYGSFDFRNYRQHHNSNSFHSEQGTSGTQTYKDQSSHNEARYQNYNREQQNGPSTSSGPTSPSNLLLANIEKCTINSKEESTTNATSQIVRYFIIKVASQKIIENCQQSKTWSFVQYSTEKRLSNILQLGHKVILFFSVGGSVCKFFGYAELESKVNTVEQPSTGNSPMAYKMKWISHQSLPHHVARHLMNGYNENRKIAATRDGHEICANSANDLITLLDQASKKMKAAQGKPLQKPE